MCHEIPEVFVIMTTLQKHLGENCTALELAEIQKVHLVLKAIGNAGVAAAPLIPTLASCAFLKSNPTSTRVAAVEAFRRIPCSANRTALIQLYQDAEESAEIRIASYYTAMKCPSQELFQTVQHTLKLEKSTQVGSFVWSHLSQLLETDDPLKQDIAEALPSDILSKDFEGESWKYSTYSDATLHSESVGANVESSLIFTPSSFIPRSAMANLTIHTMGRAINVLELGIQLENAEDLLKTVFGRPASTLNEMFAAKGEEDKQFDSPVETITAADDWKHTSTRYSHGGSTENEPDPQKMKKDKYSCQSGKYNKLNELHQKFKKGMKKNRELQCGLSMKIFGNELSFMDCEGFRAKMKQYSLSMAGMAVKLLKGQEFQYHKRLSLATEAITFPALSGFPVQLSLNATASSNIKIKGTLDSKQQANFFINGYIKPSMLLQLSAQMGVVGTLGNIGLKWITGLKVTTSLDGGIQVKHGQDLKVVLNTPEESVEIFDFSSQLYMVTVGGLEKITKPLDQIERKSCMSEEVSKLLGWQPCLELSYRNTSRVLSFPLSGPAKASLVLSKHDKGVRQYLLEASYNYVFQKDGWFPNEATIHFFMGTPKSEFQRDVGIDLHYNVQNRIFSLKLIHPKKKVQMAGKIESSRNSRNGHVEVILDDKEIYYIRGMTDLQIVGGEQRYSAMVEIKLTKHGSPIILSGNITKHFGKKIAFSVALNNLLKDTAFLSVLLDRKSDDKLKQYSLEGEAYIPGLFGSYMIGLLQQRGNLWSNAVRLKYGLLGDAKHLRHECDSGQNLKMEADSDDQYRIELQHEFQCTQIPSFNHKVHMHHEEYPPHIHSQLEVSYGKHWDEINNKKKVFISQTFKNNSNPSTSSYFMEFTLQVAEKQVNYRTQLLHTHSPLESNTNFKVQYNDRMPFVAGLQWKDSSRNDLQKWEGAFSMDTPWIYLYSAIKRYQPQRYSYQTIMEISAGKAISIKNLVLEMFHKDKGSEKEGRIHIHTPTVTYLRASTVNVFGGNAFRSYSEMVSLWNQLIKNEVHLENNEKTKSFCFKIKGSKLEFNLTADYRSMELPKKSNFSVKTMWTDQKIPPLVLQLDGQIEEVKKEKLFYQKQGLLHFRHPFKLPVPQSIVLQETFTVDKKKRHYMLETKLLLDGVEECIQTVVLGYHTDNPYICAGFTHPFKLKALPNNTDMCISTKRHPSGKYEFEATVKTNKKAAFGLKGKLENKSSKKEFWRVLQMDITHSLQLRFPRTLIFDGEIFSRQIKQGDFDHGVRGKVILNTNDTLELLIRLNKSLNEIGIHSKLAHPYQLNIPQEIQLHATGKKNGARNINGTFSIHWGDEEVILIEVDVNNDNKKNIGIIGLNASLHQTIVDYPKLAQLQITGKAYPTRFSLLSEVNVNGKTALIDLLGSKDLKVGLVLSFKGNLMHNMVELAMIPQRLVVDGSFKQKKNICEGNITFQKNQELYQINLRNRNTEWDNTSLRNVTFSLTQNGSSALPAETKLRASLHLGDLEKNVQICFLVDDRLLCVDLSNAGDQEQHGIRGTLSHNIIPLQNAGIPREGTIEITLNNTSNNRTFSSALENGSSRIVASMGIERNSTQSQLITKLKHNVHKLKDHGIPYSVDGICYHEGSSKRFLSGVSVLVEDEAIKAEVYRKNTGIASEIILSLHNDISSINNIIPSTIKVICNTELSANLLYGHCHGELTRKTSEISAPVKAVFNGSLLTNGYKTSLFGLASSGDAFVRININTEFGLHNSMEIGLKHTFSQLYALGIGKDSKIKISTSRQGRNGALLDVAIGKCLFKAICEAKIDSNVGNMSSLNWTTSLLNSCNYLEKLNFPKNLHLNGSFQKNQCDLGISLRLEYEGKDAKLNLKTSCNPYTIQASLNHSMDHLSNLGIPLANQVVFSAFTGTSVGGLVSIRAGQCKINVKTDITSSNATKWILQTDTDCKLLKDLNIPSQSEVNGSLMINGCEAELLCALTFNGNTSELQIRSGCQPKRKVEMVFRHNLPLLKGLSEETMLSVVVGKHSNHNVDILLKSGKCAFDVKGDIHTDHKLQWKMLLENKCKTVQDLGAPMKIEGSGYIVVNKKSNLDSQMLIVVDESTLQGILIVKATEKKQELDAVLTHNIHPAKALGLPSRTMVDLTTEGNTEQYKRSIQLSLDDKQINEEMSFIQKDDHIAFHYKIMHNLEILKHLRFENIMEMQAVADLKETRNLSVSAHYGTYNVGATLQAKGNETRTNLTGSVRHNWPWLLHNGVPVSIQTSLDIEATDEKQEIVVYVAGGQTLITYTVASLSTMKDRTVFFRSVHNSKSFQINGYPKVIHFLAALHKEGNTYNGNLGMEFDKKALNVSMSAIKGEKGIFEVTTRTKHSLPLLLSLGYPTSTQVLLHFILTSVDVGGTVKLNWDQRTKVFLSAHAKTQQQSNELNLKAVHNVSFLQHYIPKSSNLMTRVNYSVNEAEGKVSVTVEESVFHLLTRLRNTGTNCSNIVHLKHSFPQLRNVPNLIEFNTFYEQNHNTCHLRHVTIWGSNGMTLFGSYTGQFPKLSGGHQLLGELSHSLPLPIIQHAKVNIYLEHSVHNHQDQVFIGWNGKDQVEFLSSLKIGKEKVDCRASLNHPFNFSLRHLEISSLSERKGSKQTQQAQVIWNKGQPVNVRVTLDEQLMNNSNIWNACVTLVPGQIKQLLGAGNIQLCGHLEKTYDTFHEYMEMRWDTKKIKQNLLYERRSTQSPDSLQLEATFENIFVVTCSKQHILTKIDTNYLDTLDHILTLEFCDLPHPIVVSGTHRLHKQELKSETRLNFSPNERDDAVFSLALIDHGTKDAHNHSLSIKFKASSDIQAKVTGRYASSSDNHEILLEGKFEDHEKWSIGASNDNKCMQVNLFQHVEGSSNKRGVELYGCVDDQIALNTYLQINGTQEKLGHFEVSTANQSLSLSYEGCGEAIVKLENMLGNLASHLNTQLVEINTKFQSYVGRFQKTVQSYHFLHEAVGWPLAVSQDMARALQYNPKAFHQMWKQSGLRQMLRHDLPLYLEKMNNLVQQIQIELQRPLATLKDAYYDATLKPLDDVWQEKTEAYLKHIHALLPSIVKDEWLMEPIRRVLDGIRAGLDLGTHQILKWTEAKLSRAVGKIRKPLSNLFSFSSNCSVTVNFPMMPQDYQLTDLPNFTHYIIEEKLMKPLRDLYNVNPVAEYYRFKRRMMESPFEYHAMLIGSKHIVTFDGNIFDLTTKCSVLLARDFVNNKFTVILNQGTSTTRSLHIDMDQVAIDIHPGLKIEEDCQTLDLPFSRNGIIVKKDTYKIEVSNEDGTAVRCDNLHEICSITIAGWNHGISAGLFGTNDNEAGNDLVLPDHLQSNSTHDFAQKWQVDTQCSSGRKKIKACPNVPHQKLCKVLFQGTNSALMNCFKVISPAVFYRMCMEDVCDSHEIRPVCNLAAAYVQLCNRNFVPIEIPSQCV
ncbi:uncharacterized protein LOC128501125 [Spea bombifrons]|uniref:uncharacterized protein LOC128501125 n=1 Tax=Spea bombifrons TaxID=233779 RepID=UPI0023497DC7|nr:uncharacterized protein LOC128501125 [Spea bombifrons]